MEIESQWTARDRETSKLASGSRCFFAQVSSQSTLPNLEILSQRQIDYCH